MRRPLFVSVKHQTKLTLLCGTDSEGHCRSASDQSGRTSTAGELHEVLAHPTRMIVCKNVSI